MLVSKETISLNESECKSIKFYVGDDRSVSFNDDVEVYYFKKYEKEEKI